LVVDVFVVPLSVFVDVELASEAVPVALVESPLLVAVSLVLSASLPASVPDFDSVAVVALESVAAEDVSPSVSVPDLVSAEPLAAAEPASLSDVAAVLPEVVVASVLVDVCGESVAVDVVEKVTDFGAAAGSSFTAATFATASTWGAERLSGSRSGG
jgi:hypothetical protein